MNEHHTDLLVLGAGPGGYAAAFRAADLGRQVTLLDPRASLGGVCLNEGCIPSKALLHAAEVMRQAQHMKDWGIALGQPAIDLPTLRGKKDSIIGQLTSGLGQIARRRKVQVVHSAGYFVGSHQVQTANGDRWTFEQAIIAVGSRPITLPGWPQDPRIWDSQKALDLDHVPPRLTIVGGGIIGLEMATIFSALGARVTVVELAERLIPAAEPDAVSLLAQALEAMDVEIRTATKVTEVVAGEGSLRLVCEGEHPGTLEADTILQAVGRRANGDQIDAEAAGLAVDHRGEIAVDQACRTAQPHLFAIGDVTGAPMLAHRATHQGKVAAEVACGHAGSMAGVVIPSVAYTDPELAWAGLTSAEARQQGIAVKATAFPWAASGRNLASGGNAGLTRLLYDPQDQRLLGATVIGPKAGELLAELVLAIEMGATLTDLSLSVHAHPTLSETAAFAAERALGTLTDL